MFCIVNGVVVNKKLDMRSTRVYIMFSRATVCQFVRIGAPRQRHSASLMLLPQVQRHSPTFSPHCEPRGAQGRLGVDTSTHTDTHTCRHPRQLVRGLAEHGHTHQGCGAPTNTTPLRAFSLVSEVLLWRRGSSLIAKQVTGNVVQTPGGWAHALEWYLRKYCSVGCLVPFAASLRLSLSLHLSG